RPGGRVGAVWGGRDGALVLPVLWLRLVRWIGFVAMRGRVRAASQFDRLWLEFRDRFGLVWGQRLREQFNSSARHAGWPVVLRWQGLRLVPGAALPAPEAHTEMLATLTALMKRFGPDDRQGD